MRIIGGPFLFKQKWNEFIEDLLISKLDMVSVWNFPEVHLTLIIESFETNGIFFVNFGIFHKGEFGVSNVVCSEPFRFLRVNDCIVLEFYKLEAVEGAESFFVLS